MEFEESVLAFGDDSTLRLGIASWDKGNGNSKSIKYAWRNTNGHVSRGGEVPIEALEQMLDFAKRHGYVKNPHFTFVGDAKVLEDFGKFLNTNGVSAKVEYVIRANDPAADKDKIDASMGFNTKKERATSDLLKFSADLFVLAKKIVDYLASKKTGKIKLRSEKKTIVITKKDKEGNIVEYFEENKGSYFDIDIEM